MCRARTLGPSSEARGRAKVGAAVSPRGPPFGRPADHLLENEKRKAGDVRGVVPRSRHCAVRPGNCQPLRGFAPRYEAARRWVPRSRRCAVRPRSCQPPLARRGAPGDGRLRCILRRMRKCLNVDIHETRTVSDAAPSAPVLAPGASARRASSKRQSPRTPRPSHSSRVATRDDCLTYSIAIAAGLSSIVPGLSLPLFSGTFQERTSNSEPRPALKIRAPCVAFDARTMRPILRRSPGLREASTGDRPISRTMNSLGAKSAPEAIGLSGPSVRTALTCLERRSEIKISEPIRGTRGSVTDSSVTRIESTAS